MKPETVLFLISLVLSPSVGSPAVSDFLWASKVGGGGQDYGQGIAVDSAKNVYVTGYFSGGATFGDKAIVGNGNQDAFLCKYDSAGHLIWVESSGGAGNDGGYAVAVDGSGNCFITGSFNRSIKFDNITLTTTGDYNIFIVKYDGAGNVLWAKTIERQLDYYGLGIALDKAGNAYVTGYFVVSSEASGVFVAKYDSVGNVAWLRNDDGSGSCRGHGIAVDEAGNNWVAGSFSGTANFGSTTLTSSGKSDAFIVKHDTLGNLLWAKSAGGSEDDQGSGVGVDKAGNTYVTGAFSGEATFEATKVSTGIPSEVFIAKYSPSGTLVWVQRGQGNGYNLPFGIAVGPAGNSYITGQFGGTAKFGEITLSPNDWDVFTFELDPAGSFLWANNAGGGSGEAGYAIAADSSGDAYITGVSSSGSVTFGGTTLSQSGDNDLFVVKIAGVFFPNPPPSVEFVTAGDSGNPPDSLVMSDGTTGYGSVNYSYQIGKYEVTCSQYAAFLNSKAKSDSYSLFNPQVLEQSGVTRVGTDGNYTYSVKDGFDNKPMVQVNFYSALRFCNWLNNGGSESSDTESGAYTLEGKTAIPTNGQTVTRNPGASVFLPSENEWYKAAFYQPTSAGGPPDGYWLYATRSDTAPTAEPPPGGTNSANYNRATGTVTDV